MEVFHWKNQCQNNITVYVDNNLVISIKNNGIQEIYSADNYMLSKIHVELKQI